MYLFLWCEDFIYHKFTRFLREGVDFSDIFWSYAATWYDTTVIAPLVDLEFNLEAEQKESYVENSLETEVLPFFLFSTNTFMLMFLSTSVLSRLFAVSFVFFW